MARARVLRALGDGANFLGAKMRPTSNHLTFAVTALCSFILWYFSDSITGNEEPWDGSSFIYLFVLAIIGFACTYVFRGSPVWAYIGGIAGQASYFFITVLGCNILGQDASCNKDASFWPVGTLFLLIYSLS